MSLSSEKMLIKLSKIEAKNQGDLFNNLNIAQYSLAIQAAFFDYLRNNFYKEDNLKFYFLYKQYEKKGEAGIDFEAVFKELSTIEVAFLPTEIVQIRASKQRTDVDEAFDKLFEEGQEENPNLKKEAIKLLLELPKSEPKLIPLLEERFKAAYNSFIVSEAGKKAIETALATESLDLKTIAEFNPDLARNLEGLEEEEIKESKENKETEEELQLELVVTDAAEVTLTFGYKKKPLKILKLYHPELNPGYEPSFEKLWDLNEKCKAHDKKTHCGLVSFSSSYQLRFLKDGTCEAQVLALGEEALSHPDFNLTSLRKKLIERTDDILIYHCIQSLRISDKPVSSKPQPSFPLLFPSEFGGDPAIWQKIYLRTATTLKDDFKDFIIGMKKELEKEKALSITLWYEVDFGHVMFLAKTEEGYIGYNPDLATFYKGELSEVVNGMFSHYKTKSFKEEPEITVSKFTRYDSLSYRKALVTGFEPLK